MTRRIMVLALAVLMSASHAARAEIRALVVGANRYYYVTPLKGAVNDARDIFQALQKLDVRDRVLLLDDKARKETIRKAWFDLVARANAGDMLIFTYAGHGGQEKEQVPGSEADGKDENFILPEYSPKSRRGRKQRIVDNEINLWLKAAVKKRLKVIFVADSCHSGTMTRSLDRRAVLPSRDTPPYAIPDDLPVSEDSRKGAAIAPDELKGVLFLAATQESRKTPEVFIHGRPRGALSYAFARILEGAADGNHDRVTTLFELEDYLRATVRQFSEARQTPEVRPRGKDGPVLRHAKAAIVAVREQVGPPLKVSVLNMPLDAAADVIAHIPGAELAGPGAQAELVWDAQSKEVLRNGDVVARNVFEHQLGGVVAKWRALRALKDAAGQAPVEMRMEPDDSVHREGQRIAFRSAALKYPFVTVFNLAWNGQVQYLYPLRNDPDGGFAGRAWNLPLKVTPPFGADHLVLIASQRAPAALRARLADMGDPGGLAALLRKTLKANPHQIGIQPLLTAPGGGQ